MPDTDRAMLEAEARAAGTEGQEVPRTCENCEGLYDDSDGPEYGPPCPRCKINPKMQNLKGFPFTTPQKCFEIAWWHFVDLDEEWRNLDEQSRRAAAAIGGHHG